MEAILRLHPHCFRIRFRNLRQDLMVPESYHLEYYYQHRRSHFRPGQGTVRVNHLFPVKKSVRSGFCLHEATVTKPNTIQERRIYFLTKLFFCNHGLINNSYSHTRSLLEYCIFLSSLWLPVIFCQINQCKKGCPLKSFATSFRDSL